MNIFSKRTLALLLSAGMIGGLLPVTSCADGAVDNLPEVTSPVPPASTRVMHPDFGVPGAEPEQYSGYFTDALCTALKPEYTLDDLNAIDDGFFRNLAKSLWYGQNGQTPGADEEVAVIAYDPADHTVEVQAYLRPGLVAVRNKTNAYGRLDNASGIHVGRDENVVIFVDRLDAPLTAVLIDPMKPTPSTNNTIEVQSITLREGFNTFKAVWKGLIYLVYHTEDDGWKEMKTRVHIASGIYNGVYVVGENSPEEWPGMLAAATFSNLDIKGQYTHMILPLKNLKQHVPAAEPLVEAFDRIVYEEQVFAGLEKYDRMNPTRMTVIGGSFNGHMFASGNQNFSITGYSLNALKELMPASVLKTSGIWGPAHELGHINQLRPAFTWGAGTVNNNYFPGVMTEVSNNVLALYIQTLFGNTSRIIAQGDYAVAFRRFFVEKLSHNVQNNPTDIYDNVFNRVVPYWQLYLYFSKAGKYTGDAPEDFYKDLMEEMRNDATYDDYRTASNEQVRYCEDRFAWHVSRVAETDMVQFFNDYGFNLSPATVTAIRDMGFPEPELYMRYITDENTALYATPAEVVAGSATISSPSTNNFAVVIGNDSRNAVAYEVYRDSSAGAQPFLITQSLSFTFMSNASMNAIVIKAVGADGTRKDVKITRQ
jgi:hypothetical protein